jgi:hypothetical protein
MKRVCLAALCSVALLASAARAQTPELQEKIQTVLYVQRLQTKAGGFLAAAPQPGGAPGKPSLRATSAAVRTLKYLGGQVPDKEACVKFVEGCFDKGSGGFADVPGGKTDVFSTAVGLMAVVELGLPAEKYVAGASKFLRENVRTFEDLRIAVAGLEAAKAHPILGWHWLRLADEHKNSDGTFGKGDGKARATASGVVTTLRMFKVSPPGEKVVEALKAGQRADGGFGKEDAKGSDLESTYRVMRAFHMLKERPDVERLRAFLARCRNADGGYSVAPGQPSTVGGTYYAAIITYWLAEKK